MNWPHETSAIILITEDTSQPPIGLVASEHIYHIAEDHPNLNIETSFLCTIFDLAYTSHSPIG